MGVTGIDIFKANIDQNGKVILQDKVNDTSKKNGFLYAIVNDTKQKFDNIILNCKFLENPPQNECEANTFCADKSGFCWQPSSNPYYVYDNSVCKFSFYKNGTKVSDFTQIINPINLSEQMTLPINFPGYTIDPGDIVLFSVPMPCPNIYNYTTTCNQANWKSLDQGQCYGDFSFEIFEVNPPIAPSKTHLAPTMMNLTLKNGNLNWPLIIAISVAISAAVIASGVYLIQKKI
jgi:hypothetical protein